MKILAGVLVSLLLGAAPGWAVLGEYENSVTTDQQRMHAQLQETVRQGYSIKQLSAAGGRTVREYVSSSGLVFGIAWEGPTMPNLQQLTGSYFVQVKHAVQSHRRRGGPLIIQAKDFVLFSGGHMRSFHGMAYVPSMLPAGVPAEVIR